MRATRFLAMAAALVLACGGSGGNDDALDAADVPGTDLPVDAPGEVLADVAPDAPDPVDATDPGPADGADDPGDVPADADAPAEVIPTPFEAVNPFIGTGGAGFNVGNAAPAATAPLGLVKAGPDTTTAAGAWGMQHCSGYRYEDDRILGFSQNRLHGTGAPDYGNLRLMPAHEMTAKKAKREGLTSLYSKDGETATPGAYGVTLTDPRIRVEIGASTRCAQYAFDFLEAPARGVVILEASSAILGGRSGGGELAIDAATRTVTGRNHNIGDFSGRYGGFQEYFVIRFDRAPAGFGTWKDGVLDDGQATIAADEGQAWGTWLGFDLSSGGTTVQAQVCVSYVDLDGARASLAAEMPADFDLAKVRAAAREAWEKELHLFEVEGGTPRERIQFYTAVYHSLQMPTIWSDHDGRYQGFDKQVHQAEGTYYTDLSLWDTYRTTHPLYALVWPELQRDVVRSLGRMIADGGWAPQWAMGAGDTGSMIGQHAASVVGDSWVKGIRDWEQALIYASLAQTATQKGPPGSYGGRDCIDSYMTLGWCPSQEVGASVSVTLEYAHNDFCLARVAEGLGKAEDAAAFDDRAGNWKNVWDAETGFFRGRNPDGTWYEPFNPEGWEDGHNFTEASAWQYLWYVPHDEDGLRAAMGGDATFVERLEMFLQNAQDAFLFEVPSQWYFHGNEPDLHAPFLFIRAGRPDLAQKWVKWVREANYRNEPGGLIGNDDAGTLAAWLVFADLGLYPIPCVAGYYVNTPAFDRITVHLPGGDLKITAAGVTDGKWRIKTARWNGEVLSELWLTHDQVKDGGELVLEME